MGDVLLCVIGPHLLLVDVLLEDVAQDIRVDLVVGTQRALVEVPLILVKVVEDTLEGLIRDLDLRVADFDRMLLEQAASASRKPLRWMK